MRFSRKGCGLLSVLLLLSACGQRTSLAPVVEETRWKASGTHVTRHVVAKGETLFAIAFRYDQDYRQLAALNHVSSPYTLRVGQVINLQQPVKFFHSTSSSYTPPVASNRRNYQTPVIVKPMPRQRGPWMWPAYGKVVANFVPQQGKKGIDIAGKKGDRIVAAASGVVAYSGNGIAKYGNLIIIKHNGNFLTAYGNNAKNLVKEGQSIKAGQTIAQMGLVDRQFWGVHFEIRKAGQPVNPLNYLPKG